MAEGSSLRRTPREKPPPEIIDLTSIDDAPPIELTLDDDDNIRWERLPKRKRPRRPPSSKPTSTSIVLDLTQDDETSPVPTSLTPHDNNSINARPGPSRGAIQEQNVLVSTTNASKRRASQGTEERRQSSNVDPTNFIRVANTLKTPSAVPKSNTAKAGLPPTVPPLVTGYDSASDSQEEVAESSVVNRPSPEPRGSTDKESTPKPVSPKKVDSDPAAPSSSGALAERSRQPQSLHTPSEIPIRSAQRAALPRIVSAAKLPVSSTPSIRAFTPDEQVQARQASYGRDLLDYVQGRGPRPPLWKTVRKPETSDVGGARKAHSTGTDVLESRRSSSMDSQASKTQAMSRKPVPSRPTPASKKSIRKTIHSERTAAPSFVRSVLPEDILAAPLSRLGVAWVASRPAPANGECHPEQSLDQAVKSSEPSKASAPMDVAEAIPNPSTANEQGRTEQGMEQDANQSTFRQARLAPVVVQAIDAHNLKATTALMDERLKTHLWSAHESHAKVVRACLQRQRTCFDRETRLKERSIAQGSALASIRTNRFAQESSPFNSMQPIQTTVQAKGKEPLYFSQEIFTKSQTKASIRSTYTFQKTQYRSKTVNVPPFREYVTLRDNVLTENEKNLLNWPYFVDEEERQNMIKELEEAYKMKNVTRPHHDLLSDVSRFYGPSADALFADIGLKWQDILYWYLASERSIKRINTTLAHASTDFERVLLERKIKLSDNLRRDLPKWELLLSHLPQPTALKLRLAALASSSFLKQCGFDLWHLARRSDFLQKETIKDLKGSTEGSSFQYKRAMCRVCQMHNCLFHGELAEGPQERASIPIRPGDTNTELANPKKSGDDSDSDIEGVVNYRRAVNARTLPPWNTLEGDETSQIPNADGKFQGPWEKWAIWWDQKTNTSHWEFRKPFYPCSHEGTCEQAQCRCFRDNITCEKSCGCSLSCIRRFPGCSCAQDKKTRPCQTNCPCRQLLRECDPDLCGNCGAAEILDPINRHNEDVLWGRCRNVALQRGVPKKTLLGHSEVHGFGLYTGEAVKRGDLLGEYKGEIITRAESQRRSIVYGHQQTMYLFDLNLEQEIDSTHFGNKTRFINNSSTTSANCSAENRFCNTVHRLGLFAKKNMKAGTELFFNYAYDESVSKDFKEPGGGKATKRKKTEAIKVDGKAVAVKSTSRKPATSHAKMRETVADAVNSAGAPRRARKSAPNDSFIIPRVRARDEIRTLDDTSDAPMTGSSVPVESQELQQSDLLDDDYVPNDEEDDVADAFALPVSEDEVDAVTRDRPISRTGRRRTRRGLGLVVAVRSQSQRSETHSAAVRKRKRVVASSEDEDQV